MPTSHSCLRNAFIRPVPVVLTAALAMPGAVADVTIEQKFRVDAVGAMAVLASEGTVTTTVADRKSRTENQARADSQLVQRYARNANTVNIVLLDEQRMVTLMPERQQYSELTFEELRQQLDYGKQALEDTQAMDLPVEEGECQWSLPETSVIHTREKGQFAGVKAERHIITSTQTCTVPDTGQTCNMTFNLEHWTAKRMPGDDELEDFQAELAQALGGEDVLSAAKLNAGGLLALFRRGWNQVLAESEEMKGFPVKTVMSMEMGGDRCTTGAGTPIANDSDWATVGEIAKDAARTSAESAAANTAATTASRSVGGGLGGSIAGSAVGAGARELFKRMRNREEEEEPPPEEAGQPGESDGENLLLFKVTTELTAVSRDRVPDTQFETPDGWEKVARQ